MVSNSARLDAHDQQLNQIQSHVSTLISSVDSLKSKVSTLQSSVDSIHADVANLQKMIASWLHKQEKQSAHTALFLSQSDGGGRSISPLNSAPEKKHVNNPFSDPSSYPLFNDDAVLPEKKHVAVSSELGFSGEVFSGFSRSGSKSGEILSGYDSESHRSLDPKVNHVVDRLSDSPALFVRSAAIISRSEASMFGADEKLPRSNIQLSDQAALGLIGTNWAISHDLWWVLGSSTGVGHNVGQQRVVGRYSPDLGLFCGGVRVAAQVPVSLNASSSCALIVQADSKPIYQIQVGTTLYLVDIISSVLFFTPFDRGKQSSAMSSLVQSQLLQPLPWSVIPVMIPCLVNFMDGNHVASSHSWLLHGQCRPPEDAIQPFATLDLEFVSRYQS